MKNIVGLIMLLFVALNAQAQYPVKQSLGSKSTEVFSKGILRADSGYVQTVFADTATANLGYIKNIAGITIRVADTVYFRNAATTKWLALYSVVSGGISGSSWQLVGNLGTTAGTNFIGTLDSVDLVVKTDNTETTRFKANGNVGIGTASPTATLNVVGSSKFDGELTSNTAEVGFLKLRSETDGTFGVWTTNGGVGVTNRLTISAGASTADVTLANSNLVLSSTPTTSAGTYDVPTRNSSTGVVEKVASSGFGTVTGTGTATRVAFWSGTSALSSDADLYWNNTDKRLGIGTTSPSLKLHVNGDGQFDGTYPYLKLKPSGWSGNAGYIQAGVNLAASDAGDFMLYSVPAAKGFLWNQVSTTRLLIDTDGDIGIGTTTTDALVNLLKTTEQLRIKYDGSNYYSTTVSSTGGVTFNAVGSGAGFTYSDDTRFNTAVGINTAADATATYKLTILGDQFLEGNLWLYNGSVVGKISQNANNDIESTRNLIAPRLQLGSTADHPETSPLRVVGVVEYADNAAALLGGLTAGDVYRTGDLLKIVH